MSNATSVIPPKSQTARRVISPEKLEWKANVFRQRGWKSKSEPQFAMREELTDAFAAIDGAILQPGQGNECAAQLEAEKLDPGKEFKSYLTVRKQLESAPQPRDPALVQKVRDAANAYIAHYNKHYDWQKKQPKTLRKYETCVATLAELRKFDLRDEFNALGRPPWNSEAAMKAASIKATVDFESLPDDERTVESLKGKGVNPTFWINQKAPTSNPTDTGKAKTFLFKPQTNESDLDSFPVGGEPAREALTGRAADVLNGMTGIDFKMPETHIVAVDRSRFPDGSLGSKVEDADGTGPLVGSLQQFAPTDGEMREQPPLDKWRVSAERCQELAVLDLVTLNCDRHGGNFLMTKDTKTADLVPIDHGLTFPTDAKELGARIGGEHNALLGMPRAHEPFSDDMLAKIAKIDPDGLYAALRGEMKSIEAVHPSAKGKMPDESLEMSRRSAMFLKLAAPTLSPAAVQVALGQNAAALFDPTMDDNGFKRLAARIIQRAAAEQDTLSEFFLASPDEARRRGEALDANGWSPAIQGNPQLAMALLKQNAKRPTSPPKQPDTTAASAEELKALTAAYPKLKLTRDQDKAAAIAQWRQLEALGGMAELETALRALNASGEIIDDCYYSPKGAVDVLEEYETVQAALADADPAHGEANFARTKLALLADLAKLLPPNRQGEAAKRIKALSGSSDGMDAKARRTADTLRDAIITEVQAFQGTVMDDLCLRARDELDQYNADKINWDVGDAKNGASARMASRQGFVLQAAELIESAEAAFPGN